MAKKNNRKDISTTAVATPCEDDTEFSDIAADSPVESIDSELEDAATTLASYEIVTIPADFTLEGLLSKWNKEQLLIPGFQRKFVWSQKQASRLIESFLLGLPVPSLFLYTDPDTGAQQVIDGQQRLMSVVQFFKGEFRNANMSKSKLFRLVGLGEGSVFTDCTVTDLEDRHPSMFAKLNDSVMRAFVIKQLNPSDATSIYHIFERLNTGGTRLFGQEIRNCVYHGRLNELICTLNERPDWRKIIGKESPDARMRDVEMILRFVSLYFFQYSYRKPMKDFLSSSMRQKRNISLNDAELLSNVFNRTCQQLIDNIGEKPFHGHSGMNPAIFDAVFTTVAKHVDNLPRDFAARFKALLANKDFYANASFRTTDPEAVTKRFALAEAELTKKR
jgi:hypothetical protein